MMNFDPNGLYYQMVEFYHDHKKDQDKILFCHEGSSRSGKTWDTIFFILTYCDHNRNKGRNIYLLRESLVTCRDFLLKEVEKVFRTIGLPFNPVMYPKPYLNVWGNHVYFRGLDDEQSQEGYPSNIIFVNEALDLTSYNQVSGLIMRCEDVAIFDWNPKYSDHFMFAFEKRPNCLFTHSTYKNNKHLPITVIREIESYNPNNPVNVENGTANEWRWKVYGCGIRASMEGLVFPDVTWIDEFPEDLEEIAFGMDFGHTVSPTAICRVGRNGKNIYLEKLFYATVDDPQTLADVCKKIIGENNHVHCDSAEPGLIADLRLKGIVALAVRKFPGSIVYGIEVMKQFKIHAVRDHDLRRELENYAWKTIQGIRLNVPIDDFNHAIDGCRYACMSEFRIGERDQQYFKVSY